MRSYHYLRRFFLRSWLLCGLVPFAAWSQVELDIEGVSETKLLNNINLYVAMINKQEADGSLRYQGLIREAIDKGLRAYGYYQSAVAFEMQSPRNATKPRLLAKVNIGQPVKIAETDVVILGEAKNDPLFTDLMQKRPAIGVILNHEDYDDYKNALQKLALNRGYFDGEFRVARLEVMPSAHQAWWRLVFDSGERYHFGEVRFKNSQIREDYLRNMVAIKRNEPYLISTLSNLTHNYTSANWFSSVLSQPQIDEQNKIVNVDVFLQPRKKNSMDVGLGWASDVGPRFQLGWSKPWINSRGHSFRTSLYASAPKQTLQATYKMPLLKNPLNYYYEISMGIENEKNNDTQNLGATFAALRYWNHPTGWQYSFGLHTRYDAFTQANIQDKTLLVYPSLSIHRTRLRGGLFPTWGDTQRLSLDVGRKFWASDVDFIRFQASTTWIRTFADNHRVIGRLELGWLKTKALERIPPSLRFFAGGDRSVRGYGYKKIAPKNAQNKLVGGSKLMTASVEYQYQVYPNWWAATFADTGYAANSYAPKELHYGAGVGIRWASPVGAVKFDIATPVRDRKNSKNIQFYVGLGAEL